MNPACPRVEVRIPAHLVEPLRKGIAWTRHRESVVFGLAAHTVLHKRVILLVRDLIPLPPTAYVPAPGHGASWSGAAMLPILNAALARQCGIIIFHSHPHRGGVALSDDDFASGSRLLASFQVLVPGRPHASVVLGEDHAAGMVLLPDRNQHVLSLRVRLLGGAIEDLPSADWPLVAQTSDPIFERQVLLTGQGGELRLREAKVAVVGLSGGGSHVVQQLAHLGVGTIFGIDGGKAKTSHLARVVGMSPLDAKRSRAKTSIMESLVRRINKRATFTGVPYAIPQQRAIDALKEADVVVGCVDSYHARADLQDLASRFLIPYVDIGLLIRPTQEGAGITIGGNVITAVPGQFCQWCTGFLTKEKLDAETGGRPRSYFEGADGQAQVVSMNGVLASQAVSEVLQLLTGFAPVGDELLIKKYDGLAGTLENWIVRPDRFCSLCATALGAGDLSWTAA